MQPLNAVKTISILLCCLSLLALAPVVRGQTATNASPKQIRSIFVVPTSPKEGHDPFFPESDRLYKAAATKQVAATALLTIKGYSGYGGNRLVIINNHTFAAGDEGDVLTPGGRVHIRCLEINPGVVVVEADGHRRELKF
jgi:hypothetical protein